MLGRGEAPIHCEVRPVGAIFLCLQMGTSRVYVQSRARGVYAPGEECLVLGHPVSIASLLGRRGGRMHDLYRCRGRELEAAKGLYAPGGPEGGPASPVRPMARRGWGLRGHSLTGSLWAVATLLCSQVFTGSGIRPVAFANARVAGGA